MLTPAREIVTGAGGWEYSKSKLTLVVPVARISFKTEVTSLYGTFLSAFK